MLPSLEQVATSVRPCAVCHLTSAHPPDDVRIFAKECASLAAAGYETHLVATGTPIAYPGKVKVHLVPKPAGRLWRMLKTTWQVYRHALSLEAKLYHFHDPELVPVGLLLRAQGKPVIYDVHEDAPRSLLSREYLPRRARPLICWLLDRLEQLAAVRFSAVVTATPAIGSRFVQLQPKTVVINNYPLQNELISVEPVAWRERPNRVAYVGAMSFERGLCEMIEAMQFVAPQFEATLDLAGDLSPAQLREQAMGLPGWKHARELGVLSRAQVAELLSRARAGLVLFHPAPNHIHAQPNKLFEYMSAGLPVIASDFPLWRNLIEQAGCGLLVNPLDPCAIANAIEFVLSHPAEAEQMGQRGQAAVLQSYNWTAEECKLLDLYASLLAKSGQEQVENDTSMASQPLRRPSGDRPRHPPL